MKYALLARILHDGIDDLDAVVILLGYRVNVAFRKESAFAFFASTAIAPFTHQNDVVYSMSVCSFVSCASAAAGSAGLALMKIMLSFSLSSVGGLSVAATNFTSEDPSFSIESRSPGPIDSGVIIAIWAQMKSAMLFKGALGLKMELLLGYAFVTP